MVLTGDFPSSIWSSSATKGLPVAWRASRAEWAYVDDFLRFARAHPGLKFQVTRVGCGLAGYTNEDIAPMFSAVPPNCLLPEEWK